MLTNWFAFLLHRFLKVGAPSNILSVCVNKMCTIDIVFILFV